MAGHNHIAGLCLYILAMQRAQLNWPVGTVLLCVGHSYIVIAKDLARELDHPEVVLPCPTANVAAYKFDILKAFR